MPPVAMQAEIPNSEDDIREVYKVIRREERPQQPHSGKRNWGVGCRMKSDKVEPKSRGTGIRWNDTDSMENSLHPCRLKSFLLDQCDSKKSVDRICLLVKKEFFFSESGFQIM